jgi:hypothetical protein
MGYLGLSIDADQVVNDSIDSELGTRRVLLPNCAALAPEHAAKQQPCRLSKLLHVYSNTQPINKFLLYI